MLQVVYFDLMMEMLIGNHRKPEHVGAESRWRGVFGALAREQLSVVCMRRGQYPGFMDGGLLLQYLGSSKWDFLSFFSERLSQSLIVWEEKKKR